MKFFILPVLASLAGLSAFTNNSTDNETPATTYAIQDRAMSYAPADTHRVKHFSKVIVKKTTGKKKNVVLNDVMVYIINYGEYSGNTLAKFKECVLYADEMIIYSAKDEEVLGLNLGSRASKGVIEFRNARVIPPMVQQTKNKPLYILDGVEQTGSENVTSFEPMSIKSITVSRGALATAKYGAKAKYGAVEIITYSTSIGIEEGMKDEMITVPDMMDQGTGIVQQKMDEDPNKVYEKVEIEATFKGGEAAWRKYLEKNLDYTIPKKKGSPDGTYTVWVRFIVDKDGTVSDIKALSKHGYGMEEAAVKLIKASPTWVPAVQNGRLVKAYRTQPITFVVNAGTPGNIGGIKDEVIAIEQIDEGKPVIDMPSSDDHNKVYEKVDIEASFRGSDAGWRKYLQKNLDDTIPKRNGAPEGTYTVWLQFIVATDGVVSDIKPLTKHGFGMEEAVIKLIKDSGRWIPAVHHGRQVNAYRKQAATFVVAED